MKSILKFILGTIVMLVAGYLIHTYDAPHYSFLDFLSKYITAFGIIIAILAYYATTHKDKADEGRSKSIIAFNLINQWQMPPITDYRKDIFQMEKVDASTKSIIANKKTDDFSKILLDSQYAHYRSSLWCVLNYLEHLAISVNRKVADEEYIKDFFKSILTDYQITYAFYIVSEREKVPNLWIVFTNLADKWNK
jgi:Domain of unknown function (DUF4760)